MLNIKITKDNNISILFKAKLHKVISFQRYYIYS